jgi:hypothetical protein
MKIRQMKADKAYNDKVLSLRKIMAGENIKQTAVQSQTALYDRLIKPNIDYQQRQEDIGRENARNTMDDQKWFYQNVLSPKSTGNAAEMNYLMASLGLPQENALGLVYPKSVKGDLTTKVKPPNVVANVQASAMKEYGDKPRPKEIKNIYDRDVAHYVPTLQAKYPQYFGSNTSDSLKQKLGISSLYGQEEESNGSPGLFDIINLLLQGRKVSQATSSDDSAKAQRLAELRRKKAAGG